MGNIQLVITDPEYKQWISNIEKRFHQQQIKAAVQVNSSKIEFYFTTYLDSWGSGLKRILDACAEDGIPAPHYEIRPGCVVVVFPRPNYSEPTNISQTDRIHLSVIELTERQQYVLSVIAQNPSLTATEMSVTMSVSARTIERELSLMRKNGIIRREGRKNDGRWVVLTNPKED